MLPVMDVLTFTTDLLNLEIKISRHTTAEKIPRLHYYSHANDLYRNVVFQNIIHHTH